MLGWVIAGHDYYAQDMLDAIERRFGPQPQCCAVNYWNGLSTNMLSRMMCDALYNWDLVMEALSNPPAPNARLKSAAKRLQNME